MKCNDIKLELSQYIRGELSTEKEQTVKKHLEQCVECQLEHQMIVEMEELFVANRSTLKMPMTTEKRISSKAKRVQKVSFIKKVSSLVAALLVLSLITTATISPAFAEFVSNIPGISQILDFIKHDSSLRRAIENDMMQPINEVIEYDGMRIHIEGLVADDSNIIVFYAIENLTNETMNWKHIYIGDITIGDKKLPTASGSSSIPEIKPGEIQRNTITILYNFEGEEPRTLEETLTMQIFMTLPNESPSNYPLLTTVNINVDVEKFENLTEIIKIEEDIIIEGQRVYVEKLVIKPTEAILYYKYHENNTKEILQTDFKLMDEKGNIYGVPSGAIITIMDQYKTTKLETPIFVDYKELYLVGGSFNVVDKEDAHVVIDLEEQKILNGPEDIKWVGVNVDRNRGEIGIEITHPNGTWFNSSFTDLEGNQYSCSGMSFHGDNNTILWMSNELKNDTIKIQLNNYPDYINKQFKIRVK